MENKNLETIKTPQLQGHGTFIYGKLDNVDFTVAGEGVDDNNRAFKYGHSVKLFFMNTVQVEKELGGNIRLVDKVIQEVISIPCESEDDIANKLNIYEPLRGKEILAPILNTKEKTTYKINDANLVIVDKK